MIYSTLNLLIWVALVGVTLFVSSKKRHDFALHTLLSRILYGAAFVWFGLNGLYYSVIEAVHTVESIWNYFK